MEDDDPDVRATAAVFLASLSPELAEAATESYLVGMPTREVLALQRRARVPPPERPTLEEMSDDELVARFEDAALRESGAGFLDYLDNPADKDVQNRIVGEVWAIMRQLKARGLLAGLSRSSPATIAPFVARRRSPAFAPPRRKQSACWRTSPSNGGAPARDLRRAWPSQAGARTD